MEVFLLGFEVASECPRHLLGVEAIGKGDGDAELVSQCLGLYLVVHPPQQEAGVVGGQFFVDCLVVSSLLTAIRSPVAAQDDNDGPARLQVSGEIEAGPVKQVPGHFRQRRTGVQLLSDDSHDRLLEIGNYIFFGTFVKSS